MSDDEAMQAECVVRVIDDYLATMPWPLSTAAAQTNETSAAMARGRLVKTLAASFRMSEKRKSQLQNN